ncbi:MAG: hypothetical protein WC861_01370 [Candidatus Micrarchaeia archaeon]|jgi:hypothetical protein
MKGILLVLAVALALLISGCAQSQPQSPQPPAAPAAPPALPAAPAQNQSNNSSAVAPAPPAAPTDADTCAIEFQKDASSVYYVMVKTSSPKKVSVTCPNGKGGQQQGGLFFCSQLDVPSPAIAYLDGKECARSQFSAPALGPGAQGKQQCTVLLGPSRITAGQTSTVTVKAYAPQERSNLTYNCGDREVTETVGGMVDTGKICKFGTPGTIEVYARINGVACGNAFLSVFSSPKDCFVFGSKAGNGNGIYNYTARVAARGYSGGDELIYRCYDIAHTVKASSIQNTTDFIVPIECSSASGPLSQNVKVSMGGDACGEMVVAQ